MSGGGGEGNAWRMLVEESSEMSESPLLYRVHPHKSLIQMQQMLRRSIESMLQVCASISDQLSQSVGIRGV